MSRHGPRKFRRRTADGEGRTFVLDTEALEMSSDIYLDAAALAGTMGLVAELRGDIERELLEADAGYRSWRGRLVDKMVAENPKLAATKLEKVVNGDPDFLRHKRRIAKLEGDAVYTRAFFDACQVKAQMIRVLAGDFRGRASGEALDRNDSERPRPLARPPHSDREQLRERARQVLRGKEG